MITVEERFTPRKKIIAVIDATFAVNCVKERGKPECPEKNLSVILN